MNDGVDKLIEQLKKEMAESVLLAISATTDTIKLDLLSDKITAKNKLLELHLKVNKNIQQIKQQSPDEGDVKRRATATGRHKK